jgi:hypothetical protein
VRRPLAEQRRFVLGRRVRLLAGEEGGSNLGDLGLSKRARRLRRRRCQQNCWSTPTDGPERERRANAGPVDDDARFVEGDRFGDRRRRADDAAVLASAQDLCRRYAEDEAENRRSRLQEGVDLFFEGRPDVLGGLRLGARPFATASEFAGSGVAGDGGPTSTGDVDAEFGKPRREQAFYTRDLGGCEVEAARVGPGDPKVHREGTGCKRSDLLRDLPDAVAVEGLAAEGAERAAVRHRRHEPGRREAAAEGPLAPCQKA